LRQVNRHPILRICKQKNFFGKTFSAFKAQAPPIERELPVGFALHKLGACVADEQQISLVRTFALFNIPAVADFCYN
jgi:hypothetical protein